MTHARALLTSSPGGATDYIEADLRDPGRSDIWPRDRAEFTALFDGLDLVEPGVALATDWRPDNANGKADDAPVDRSRVSMWAAVARKP